MRRAAFTPCLEIQYTASQLKVTDMLHSSYHLQFEQKPFHKQTGKHSTNSACICHSHILNNEVISEWKGNIGKNLSIEYGYPSRTCLMEILSIHSMIYLPVSLSVGPGDLDL